VADISLHTSLETRSLRACNDGREQHERDANRFSSHGYLHSEFGQDWLTRLTIIVIARWAARAAPSCQPMMWLQWSPAK